MKMKWISTMSALAIVGTGCLAAIPTIINNQSNVSTQKTDANQIVETNNIKHSKNVQVVNAVDKIVVESVNHSNQSSAAIVNNNGKQEIYVWGNNYLGGLGLGDQINRPNPTLLDSTKLGNYTSIKKLTVSPYAHNMVAIVNTVHGEQIYVWGNNNSGELGIPNNFQLSPILFDTSRFGEYTEIKKIHFSDSGIGLISNNSFAIVSTPQGVDKIYVWGYNKHGQLGLGDKEPRLTPTLFNTSVFGAHEKIEEFMIGSTSYAIIRVDNYTQKLFLWGINSSGQCATNNTEPVLSPRQLISTIFDDAKIKIVKINDFSIYMVLIKNGVDELYSWGLNNAGQVGNGGFKNQTSPYRIPQSSLGGATQILDINNGLGTAVRVMSNGLPKVYVWGFNAYGQLGLGDDENKTTPVLFNITKLGNALEIYEWSFDSTKHFYSTSAFAYVRTASGDRLFTWGNNQQGQLGLGDEISKTNPSQVNIDLSTSRLTNFNKNMESSLTFSIEKNGESKIHTSGFNGNGNLGTGDLVNQSLFTPILPTRRTNPQAKMYYPTNLTSSQALDQFNHNNVLDKVKLSDYVDISTFPTTATLSIDPATTISDYENGILNLGIKTTHHNELLIKNTTTSTPKTFNVVIDGFEKAKDINTNPVVAISRYADANSIDSIYEHIVDSDGKVINRPLLEYYFDLSSIPPNAVLHLYRTSFGNNLEATFTFTSSEVYDNRGMILNQEYTKTDLVLSLIDQTDWALIISLSVVGGALLISIITIIIMLVKKYHHKNKFSI